MLDVEEVAILVNDDKVGLRGNVNWKAFFNESIKPEKVKTMFQAFLHKRTWK